VPYRRIVQTWRTTQFTDEHADSVITVTLEDVVRGTLLTLVHSNVPDDQTGYEAGGWQTHYFQPMQAFFRRSGQSHTADKPALKRKRAAAGANRTAGPSGETEVPTEGQNQNQGQNQDQKEEDQDRSQGIERAAPLKARRARTKPRKRKSARKTRR